MNKYILAALICASVAVAASGKSAHCTGSFAAEDPGNCRKNKLRHEKRRQLRITPETQFLTFILCSVSLRGRRAAGGFQRCIMLKER